MFRSSLRDNIGGGKRDRALIVLVYDSGADLDADVLEELCAKSELLVSPPPVRRIQLLCLKASHTSVFVMPR